MSVQLRRSVCTVEVVA